MRYKILTMDSDVSGVMHSAVAYGHPARRMTSTGWTGDYIVSMPMWWVGRRAREIKLDRTRREA